MAGFGFRTLGDSLQIFRLGQGFDLLKASCRRLVSHPIFRHDLYKDFDAKSWHLKYSVSTFVSRFNSATVSAEMDFVGAPYNLCAPDVIQQIQEEDKLAIPLRKTKKNRVADATEMLSKASTQTGAEYEQ